MINTDVFPHPGRRPLVPGRFYTAPCVRAYWPLREISGAQPNWIPVIGPAHADNDAVNFPIMHWHADHRFLNFYQLHRDSRIRNHYRHLELSEFCLENAAFLNPVVEIAPLNVAQETSEQHVNVSNLDPAKYPAATYLKHMVMMYRGETPAFVFSAARYLPELTEQYRDKKLIEGRYCPHRRADLGSVPEDEDGIVTCPLHGLRWHKATGQIAEARPRIDHDPFDPYYTEPRLIAEREAYELQASSSP